MLSKVIGMISWLPDDERRESRITQLQKAFNQLGAFFPRIPIMVIAQNWKDAAFKVANPLIRFDYEEGLGILGARKELRNKFLESDFDYLIMVDDDIIIHCDSKDVVDDYLRRIDENPKGFACVKRDDNSTNRRSNHPYQPYAMAELNLCTISRYIYEREPMVEIDATKGETYEDGVFSALLHYKWGEYEWDIPDGLYHNQYCNDENQAVSTWFKDYEKEGYKSMGKRYYCLLLYIHEHHDLPEDMLKHILQNVK